jgi:heat shock protein HtpX
VLAVLAPLKTNLIKLRISRKREYLADASGRPATRDTRVLADALGDSDDQDCLRADQSHGAFFLLQPFNDTRKFMAKPRSAPPPLLRRG